MTAQQLSKGTATQQTAEVVLQKCETVNWRHRWRNGVREKGRTGVFISPSQL